ncbi:MAG TPA: hypothetical protein VHA53_00755 [Nitrolancea sp.]|jgi:hypothetical protein|nr:hypothetical protein [Nitrolancea sp.]
MAENETTSKTNPEASKLQQGERHPQPARGTLANENVSWEEKRKGEEPQTPEGIDETFYNERFTSERQKVDRASREWQVLERDEFSPTAPNWPPPLRP